MSTTTIRLPEALKARVASAAKRAGTTTHGFILEAIAEKTAQEERRAEFDAEAEARYARIVASGKTISWQEMRGYLQARIDGKAAKLPEAARVNPARVHGIEEQVRHDVIAFPTTVQETVRGPEAARWLHYGLTSNDVVDTAQALLVREASRLIEKGLGRFGEILEKRAWEFKDTPEIGRTHGIHAEPITFGLKVANWYAENRRDAARFEIAAREMAVGKISGAVGTCTHLGPDIEEKICRRLGLATAPITSQVIERDRHAQYLAALAIVAASLERVAIGGRGPSGIPAPTGATLSAAGATSSIPQPLLWPTSMYSMKRTMWPLPRKWRAIGTTLSSLTPRLTTAFTFTGSPAAAAASIPSSTRWTGKSPSLSAAKTASSSESRLTVMRLRPAAASASTFWASLQKTSQGAQSGISLTANVASAAVMGTPPSGRRT